MSDIALLTSRDWRGRLVGQAWPIAASADDGLASDLAVLVEALQAAHVAKVERITTPQPDDDGEGMPGVNAAVLTWVKLQFVDANARTVRYYLTGPLDSILLESGAIDQDNAAVQNLVAWLLTNGVGPGDAALVTFDGGEREVLPSGRQALALAADAVVLSLPDCEWYHEDGVAAEVTP